MAKSITLSASARFGYGGKQFVARITGRHSKFVFEREFLGRKEGKRGESTSATVDEPGLYTERDVDSKGRADDTYRLVWRDGDTLHVDAVSLEDAMAVARRLDNGDDVQIAALELVLAEERRLLADAKEKDPDEIRRLGGKYAARIGLEGEADADGVKAPRRALIAARERWISHLEAMLSPATAPTEPAPTIDLSAVSTEALRAELARRGTEA